MHHRTLRTIGATVVLFGLAVASIMQIETDTPQPAEIAVDETVPPTSGEPGTTGASKPFVYRIGVLSGLSTDNYWAYYGEEPSVWNSYILGPTKPALYTLDAGSGTIAPELAVEDVDPTWDEDGWRVRVQLDDAFRWSDGTPITAEDFVFTFETVRALGLGGSWADSYPETVESMHADADHKLRIEFGERPTLGVWPYGVGLAPVMPAHIWSEHVEHSTATALYDLTGAQDVSGGPLIVAAASTGLVVSNANPGYPRAGTPDVIEYHVYPDDGALLAALAAGEIDTVLTPKGIGAEGDSVLGSNPSIDVMSSPANAIRYLGFNLERAPMSEQAFRRALALLIDRDRLADAIPQTGDAAWTMIPAANTHWFGQETARANRQPYEADLATRLAQALEGLKSAGYAWETEPGVDSDGRLVAGVGLTIGGVTPQPLTILSPGDAYDPARLDYVGRIASVLDNLGFDARPVETDFDTVVDLAFTPDDDGSLHYDMYVLGWTLGNPVFPAFYRPFFAGDGVMNNTGYESEAFAAALADYEGAFTKEEATAALAEMELTLATDLPYLPLYTSEITEAYRSDRVWFTSPAGLGGIQARLGAIHQVRPKG